MGSFVSKNTNDDWNDAFNQAAQHNRIVEERGDQLASFDGEATGRSVALKEKPLHKLKINYFIDEHIEWEPSKKVVNQFDYKITIKSLVPGILHARVNLWAKLIADNNGKFERIETVKNPLIFLIDSQEKKIEFSISMDQIIPGSFRDGKPITPIIVELFDDHINVLNFFNLERKEGFKPVLTHRGLVYGGMYTELENVYGLRTSSLVNKQNSEKCAICMDNDIDTIVKPCNHMCMCHDCAELLKMQTKLCPICRNPFSSFSKVVLKE
jgi:hypothetical protein